MTLTPRTAVLRAMLVQTTPVEKLHILSVPVSRTAESSRTYSRSIYILRSSSRTAPVRTRVKYGKLFISAGRARKVRRNERRGTSGGGEGDRVGKGAPLLRKQYPARFFLRSIGRSASRPMRSMQLLTMISRLDKKCLSHGIKYYYFFKYPQQFSYSFVAPCKFCAPPPAAPRAAGPRHGYRM